VELYDTHIDNKKYDPEMHHRRSIRLKGYDYSHAGVYYVTICSQNRLCLFGEIREQKMFLNDAGLMIKSRYEKCGEKFPDVECREMVIMPNHIHCIFRLVGADPRVCPNPYTSSNQSVSNNFRADVLGEHTGSPLHRVCNGSRP